MFVTRKRKYSTVSEIGTSTTTQTLYIGSKPFFLRLYNKKEELKKSSKKDMMYEYFLNNGFNLDDEIFNIEFEMHRTFLKQYNILTVDDILKNAQKLFMVSMEDIKLIDLDSISKKDKEHNKYKADIHPLWEHIKQSYNLKQFLQSSLPLERIKRKVSIYDDKKFKIELIAVLRRAFINNLIVEPEHLDFYYYEAKESLKKTTTQKEINKTYEILDNYINPQTGKKEKARLLEDGTIVKPLNTVSVKELSDYDLFIYLDKLVTNKNLSTKDNQLWQVAHDEAVTRGLVKDRVSLKAKP